MADEKKLSPEEEDELRRAEIQKLHDAERERRDDAAAAREHYKETGEARLPRPSLSVSQGLQPTFPNVPGEGYRPNPANMKNQLPPERQAPRPPDHLIGTGRVKPSKGDR